jgi:hypothetical protein
VVVAAAMAAVALVGCGSAGTFANKPRPATPVNLTVYINDHRVSVSPASVGAGPVQFIVTNEATKNETLEVVGGASALANTGPINPGGTANVTVNFSNRGEYLVSTRNSSAASAAATSSIAPARLRIGPPRPSASSALLQP